ncbi:hypothetical protein AMATHDRAFT_135121 [Amanita thiersii Skay4041]|uniref:Phosphatidylinositol-specific phospholipase C X domain-containing protein n=1 Tax=Amanita thiersii Skay4041 TaxID=703135 RepID=A0A2A9P1U2_9AGAR|nr:hypothetical protein AMATHDRAFT_135121 [Amanita thiersii Skay4041]
MLPSSFSKLTQVVASIAVHALLLSSSLVPANAHSIARRATVCNGHPELCDRSYGNVSFVGAHDSYAFGPLTQLGVNQDQNVTQQLNDGIRMLQMQAHLKDNQIFLCHTSCTIQNGGSLEDYLKTVKNWLDANPTEVLSLLIVNIDNLVPSQYDTVFKAVGLDAISYAPPTTPVVATSWPTLGSMIDSGKRLVTFLDNGADSTSVPYLIDEFTNIWETAFNVIDPNFDCNVNRTKAQDPSTQLYLINHFLDKLLLGQAVPDIDRANQTNAATGLGSLGVHVDTCVAQHSKPPNFLLVDFYEFGGGSVFEVAARINGVSYNPSTPIAVPATGQAANPTSTSGALPMQPLGEKNLAWTIFVVFVGIAFGAYNAI